MSAEAPPNTTSGNGAAYPTHGWRATFASLSIPEYAWYFWGMLAFFSGMNMMIVLRGYLVYDITKSETALAMIMLTVAVPMLVIAPVAGVIVDRVDRRTLMFFAQAAVFLLNGVNTVLIWTGVVELWHLLLISTFSGSAFAFNMPARQAAMPNLVPRELLMNAMSLGTSAMNVTRIVAPAAGGLLIQPIGMGGAFAVMTAIYGLSILFTLGLPKMPPQGRGETKVTFFSDFAGGFSYIRSNRLLLGLLLFGTVPMIFALPYQTLLPVFAEEVWDKGSVGLGLLQAMAGAGGLAGAMLTANLDRSQRKGHLMFVAAVLSGAFLIAFSYSFFGLALAMMALIGLTSMVFMTVNNTMIASIIPDHVRGRVSSVLMMTFGLMPFGAVPAGIAAEIIGTPAVVAIGGGMLIAVVAMIYLLFPQFRSIDGAVQIERADRDREFEAAREAASAPAQAAGS